MVVSGVPCLAIEDFESELRTDFTERANWQRRIKVVHMMFQKRTWAQGHCLTAVGHRKSLQTPICVGQRAKDLGILKLVEMWVEVF